MTRTSVLVAIVLCWALCLTAVGFAVAQQDENNTWFTEYDIPLASIGLTTTSDLSQISLHITAECGNDVITSAGSTATEHGVPPPSAPEPMTLIGVGLAFVAAGSYFRRRGMKAIFG